LCHVIAAIESGAAAPSSTANYFRKKSDDVLKQLVEDRPFECLILFPTTCTRSTPPVEKVRLADERMRTYEPDFIVRCVGRPGSRLILETKMARDEHKEAKRAAALRWCAAMTASGKFGEWRYDMVSRPEEVRAAVERFLAAN